MKNVKPGHACPIVCLDAGHAGKYNRSPVVPAYYESDMNWKLHLLLKAQLESYGIQVKTTRASQGRDLALDKRGKASKGCDLFLSIHSNAAGTESVDRPEGIYLVDDNCGEIDEMSKELAILLSDIVARVMQTKQKAKQYSKHSGNDRDGDGLKNDDYYGVLYGAHQVGTAGVILEHSFHTNTRAARWLLEDANLEKLAKAEAAAVASYFGVSETQEKTPSKTTEKLYRVRKSWEDAGSQVGAYKSLENAKKACKEGFIVYDWNGVAMYAPAPAGVQLDAAASFDRSKAGLYTVKAINGLNLRAGASVNKRQLEVMAHGSTFQCYGYYTAGWLYGVSESGKMGFCSEAYLARK